MSDIIKVAILEDHLGIVDSYVQRIGSDPQIALTALLRYGEAVEPTLQKEKIDVLILDLEVKCSPENSNPYPVLLMIPRLLMQYPDLAIIVISGHCRRVLVHKSIGVGAVGYVVKDDWEAIEELPSIIKLAKTGNVFVSKQARHFLRESTESSMLPDRELEALTLCAAYPGEKTGALAEKMSVADSTMRNLLSSAYKKLGVKSRTAAVSEARSRGLLIPTWEFDTHA